MLLSWAAAANARTIPTGRALRERDLELGIDTQSARARYPRLAESVTWTICEFHHLLIPMGGTENHHGACLDDVRIVGDSVNDLLLRSFVLFGALASSACGPIALDYMDFETYVRPGVSAAHYKSVAILYVGFGEGSTLVQDEDVGLRGEQANNSDEDRMVVTGSETRGADVMLYSNALMTAFDKRGVRLVERARIRDVVREQGLATNRLVDLSDTELLERIGRMLKVDLIVRGTVYSNQGGVQVQPGGFGTLQQYYSGATGLSVRGIDTRTGQVVWMETAFGDRRIAPGQYAKREPLARAQVVNDMVDRMVGRFLGG
jgi:hypothetical protein